MKKTCLGRILTAIFTLVLLLVLVFAGAYIYVQTKYDISISQVLNQIKILNEPVKEDTLVPNKIKMPDDIINAKANMDKYLLHLITKDGENYSIHFDTATVNPDIITTPSDMKISDKDLCAIINTHLGSKNILDGVDLGTIKASTVPTQLLQIKFDNIVPNTSADINIVLLMDLTKVKSGLKSFPMNFLAKKIPNQLYISSTTTIKKGVDKFNYTVENKSLTINNLKNEDVVSVFNTINKFTTIGSVDAINIKIGNSVADILIGNASKPNGFTYKLKDKFADDFDFEHTTDNNYFVIKHKDFGVKA